MATLTSNDRQGKETEGFLILPPESLATSVQNWETNYRQIKADALRITPGKVTIASLSMMMKEVKQALNSWLNSNDEEWRKIRDSLIAIANQLVEIQAQECHLIIDANDVNLFKLPWQEWDVLQRYYPHTEVALTVSQRSLDTVTKIKKTLVNHPRILVVVGHTTNINSSEDLAILDNLTLKGAEVKHLMQPSIAELCHNLRDEIGYHIFIFIGHSCSRVDGKVGWMELSDSESISPEDFQEAVKVAVEKGLKLAIFNSCDGLGLARQMAELNLPYSIIMREPVPDRIAIDFLRYFFQNFTENQSIFNSLLNSRRQLEPHQAIYPGALWLPALFILKPFAPPLTWSSLFQGDSEETKIKPQNPSHLLKKLNLLPLKIILPFLLGIFTTLLAIAWVSPSQKTNFKSLYPVAGNWRYGGSTTWAPIRHVVDEKISQVHPQFKLIYTPSSYPHIPEGSVTGIGMLLQGQISFAQSSRPLIEQEYQTAHQQNFTLRQIPVAIDGIAIAVHPDLPIPSLTLPQIKDIYTGKISNWQQLGGPDLKILPYYRPKNSGTTSFFQETILANQGFGKNVIAIEATTPALRAVQRNLGGIYYASSSEVVGQCGVKPLAISYQSGSTAIAPYQGDYIPPARCRRGRKNTVNYTDLQNASYPLTRRLFVVIKKDGSPDQQAGEDYAQLLLTTQGQNLIKEAGFIPLRP
jgi:ABC-type phosphate transport system substrate-binding protein